MTVVGDGAADRHQPAVPGRRRDRTIPNRYVWGNVDDLGPGRPRSGDAACASPSSATAAQALVGSRPVQQLADHRVRGHDDQRGRRRRDLDDHLHDDGRLRGAPRPATARATPCGSRWSARQRASARRRRLATPARSGPTSSRRRPPALELDARSTSGLRVSWTKPDGGAGQPDRARTSSPSAASPHGDRRRRADPVGTQLLAQHPGAGRSPTAARSCFTVSARNSAPNTPGHLERGGRHRRARRAADRGRGARRHPGRRPTAPPRASRGPARSPTTAPRSATTTSPSTPAAAPTCTVSRRRRRRSARQPADRRQSRATSAAGRRARLRRPDAEPDVLDHRVRLQRPGLHGLDRRCRSPRARRRAPSPRYRPAGPVLERRRHLGLPARRLHHRHPARPTPTSFEYRLTAATPTSPCSGPIAPGGPLLLTSNGSQYGNTSSVQVKACKTYPRGDALQRVLVARRSRSARPSTTAIPGASAPSTPSTRRSRATGAGARSPTGADYTVDAVLVRQRRRPGPTSRSARPVHVPG